MMELISQNLTYSNVAITLGVGILVFILKEQRRHCNMLIKIKTALVLKFPDLGSVLK